MFKLQNAAQPGPEDDDDVEGLMTASPALSPKSADQPGSLGSIGFSFGSFKAQPKLALGSSNEQKEDAGSTSTGSLSSGSTNSFSFGPSNLKSKSMRLNAPPDSDSAGSLFNLTARTLAIDVSEPAREENSENLSKGEAKGLVEEQGSLSTVHHAFACLLFIYIIQLI